MNEVTSSWEKSDWIVAISSAVLVISAFLTWVHPSIAALGFKISGKAISGIGTQAGYITLAIGVIILGTLLMKKTYPKTIITLGAISGLLGLGYLWYIPHTSAEILELQSTVGIGVYLTIITGIGLIVGGFLAKRRK